VADLANVAHRPETVPLVELEKISKHFGDGDTRVDALREVSITVYPGEIVGLVGPSGSGKSTLLNVVACILEPSSGQMRLDGDLVYDNKWLKSDLRKLRLDKIGFIFQFHNLLPFLNTTENVALVLELAGVTSAEASRRAMELLDYLGVGNRKNAMPSTVSGGEAQRVAIARAMANHPRIILADEPTAALDSQRAGVVMDLMRRVATERKAGIIVVSHDEKIFNRFNRIFHLRDGYLENTETNNQLH
jgi:putative ABC transport system ATP-binding protein